MALPSLSSERSAPDVRGLVRRRPVASFIVIAFAWSWGYDALVYATVGPTPGILVRGVVRAWGPLVAAGLVTAAIGGDLRAWAGQVTRWRVHPAWYAVAVALPLLWEDGLAVSVVHLATGGAVSVLPSPWWHYVANFLVVLLLAGSLEEFGWRGFAQPRLQERVSALAAAVGIGVAWALWHAPLFVLYDVPAYDASRFWPAYTVGLVLSSVVLAWLYNATGGSLVFPMVAHAMGNLPAVVAPAGPVAPYVDLANQALVVVVVAGLLAVYGPRYLARRGPVPPVPGAPRTDAGGTEAS